MRQVVTRLDDDQIEELREMFPDCPNPKHEPHRFMFYVRMYLYYVRQ